MKIKEKEKALMRTIISELRMADKISSATSAAAMVTPGFKFKDSAKKKHPYKANEENGLFFFP